MGSPALQAILSSVWVRRRCTPSVALRRYTCDATARYRIVLASTILYGAVQSHTYPCRATDHIQIGRPHTELAIPHRPPDRIASLKAHVELTIPCVDIRSHTEVHDPILIDKERTAVHRAEESVLSYRLHQKLGMRDSAIRHPLEHCTLGIRPV